MAPNVYSWSEIEKDFKHGLILGNGASIAFSSKFAYDSLKKKAEILNLLADDVQSVFEFLETNDFELVLRVLWHANKVNQAFNIFDDRTNEAYKNVRNALIEVVQKTRVSYSAVRDQLATAAKFMSHFSTVISLNYDVLVYWALLVGNEPASHRFKDCFVEGAFRQEWKIFYEPYGANQEATLVFYPHGNLALAADLTGSEIKVQAGDAGDLLETIFEKWRSGEKTPVFVSEGTSEQKRAAIRRSPYLSTVYNEVLPSLGESIVVFGWSMGDQDDHLLDAICRGKPHRFAIAVDPAANNLEGVEAKFKHKLKTKLGTERPDVVLFDRSSEGCWINPKP
jgi:hypothetical protein